MKASIVGGFTRDPGWTRRERPCGQRTRRGDGNPICRHFCADIVRLFISTPSEIGKKRAPLYCRIGILPRIRRRAFSAFFTFALARHARLYNYTLHRAHIHIYVYHRRLAARLCLYSLRAANFVRFHATRRSVTTLHCRVVVNFQLTNNGRNVSEYRREFTSFSPVVPPVRCRRESYSVSDIPFVVFASVRRKRKI